MNALQIKLAAARHLARRPWMIRKQVEVLADDEGSLASKISAALAKLGAVAVVGNLAAKATSSASRTIACESTLVVTLYEAPLVNRERADHADIAALAEYVAGALNLAALADPAAPGEAALPVFRAYAVAWETPAGAKATATFTVQSTITPPEE
jgi:hypothetical protein